MKLTNCKGCGKKVYGYGYCSPLKMYEDNKKSLDKSHYSLSQLFTGLELLKLGEWRLKK